MKLASPAVRARLFNLLGAKVAKGLTEAQALKGLAAEQGGERVLRHARQALERGVSFTRAGMAAGLFSPIEATLLDAGIASDSLGLMLRRLAMRLEARVRHGRALWRRLLLPVCVFSVSLLVLPLPLIPVFGALGKTLYLFFVGGSASLLALALLVLPRAVDSTRFEPAEGLLSEIGFTLPWLAAAKRRRNTASFLEALGFLLQANVPLASAISRATLAVSGNSARNELKRVALAVGQHLRIEEALARAGNLDAVTCNVLQSGAATGRLTEFALQRGGQMLEEIRRGDVQLVKRFAIGVYGLALLWFAADVLG